MLRGRDLQHLITSIQHCTGAGQLGKKKQIGKEKVESSLTDNFSVYRKNPKQSTEYLLDLVSELISVIE